MSSEAFSYPEPRGKLIGLNKRPEQYDAHDNTDCPVEPDGSYTETPNAFYDELLAQIDNMAELKITLAIIRKTRGWHKEQDVISYDQLAELTGLSRSMISQGLERGQKRGSIKAARRGKGVAYSLDFASYRRGFKTNNRHETPPIRPAKRPRSSDTELLWSSDTEPVQTPNFKTQEFRHRTDESSDTELMRVQTPNTQKKLIKETIKETNKEREGGGSEAALPPPPLTNNVSEDFVKKHHEDAGRGKKPKPAAAAAVQPAPAQLQHPAIEAHQSKRYKGNKCPRLNEQQQHKIIAAIGDDPTRLKNWAACLDFWSMSGWAGDNVRGMLDRFSRGQYEGVMAADDSSSRLDDSEVRGIGIKHEQQQQRTTARPGRSNMAANGTDETAGEQERPQRYSSSARSGPPPTPYAYGKASYVQRPSAFAPGAGPAGATKFIQKYAEQFERERKERSITSSTSRRSEAADQ